MITRVFGRNITHKYKVDTKQKEVKNEKDECKIIYTGKPCMIEEKIVEKGDEICHFEGQPMYNNTNFFGKYFNISEDDEVAINKEVFRADLNELHLTVNKVLLETHKEKEEAEEKLNEELKCFNKQMILSNERLKSYCDVHKLNMEETDCGELFKIVYGHSKFIYKNGVMEDIMEDVKEHKTDGIHVNNISNSLLSLDLAAAQYDAITSISGR